MQPHILQQRERISSPELWKEQHPQAPHTSQGASTLCQAHREHFKQNSPWAWGKGLMQHRKPSQHCYHAAGCL